MKDAPIEIKQALKNAADNYKANGLGELDADTLAVIFWHSVDEWTLYFMDGALYLTPQGANPNRIIKEIQQKVVTCGLAVNMQAVARHIARFLREQGGSQQSGRAHIFKTTTISQAIAEAENARKAQTLKFNFGIDALDNALCGVYNGQMLSIFGNPGSYKTALLTNGIANWIANGGGKVLLFELDMDKNAYMERLLSRKLDCPTTRLAEIASSDKYQSARQQIIDFCDNGARFVVMDKCDATGELWTVEKVVEAIEREEPAVVCIDYLTLLKPEGAKNKPITDYEIANAAIDALYNACKTYGNIIVTLSQMSMESRRIQAQGGSGGTAKGGGKVEERSDAVIELYKDTGADEAGNITSDIIATVRKARNNDAGTGQSFRLEHHNGKFNSVAERVQRKKKKQERLFETVNYQRYF